MNPRPKISLLVCGLVALAIAVPVWAQNNAPSFTLPPARPYSPWTVSTLAGTAGISGSTDGTGAAARFDHPWGVAVDSAGNLYVADWGGHVIRKITPAGAVTTLAGSAGSRGSADGTGAAARFSSPIGVAVDNAGNVYVADEGNGTIRKITTPAGMVSTLAGTAGVIGSADGIGAGASFGFPSPKGIAVDSAGNVYVADAGNHTIRKVTPAGMVTTLAGTAGQSGTTDGIGAEARFDSPDFVVVDGSGNLYVYDRSSTSSRSSIRQITPASQVTTIFDIYNSLNGIAVDAVGNIYLANSERSTIEASFFDGFFRSGETLAGDYNTEGSDDGIGSAARFSFPYGVAVDKRGIVYVADTFNNTIRKLTPSLPPSVLVTVWNDWGDVRYDFISNISPGPPSEASQVVDFIVTNDNNALFSVPPVIDSDGVLRFTPATNSSGTARVTVVAHDNGGTTSGGVDSSAPQFFTITVVPVSSPPPEILIPLLSATNIMGGSNALFSITATNATIYQWLFNGVPIQDQTNADLSLSGLRRTNSGAYSVIVTGPGGSITSTPTLLRVPVPQRLPPPQRQPNGAFRLLSSDRDGGKLRTNDLPYFEILISTNLSSTNWIRFTNGFTLTNGTLFFDDVAATNHSRRFYRVIEK